MWMALGLAAFLMAVIYKFDSRYKQGWSGKTVTIEGIKAQHRSYFLSTGGILFNIRYFRKLNIGIDGVSAMDLSLKRRRWWDSLFTWLGVTVSCKTAMASFEQHFYVLSDNEQTCQILRGHAELLEIMQRLPKICERRSVTLKSLNIRKGRIWVELGAKYFGAPEPDLNFILPEIVPVLDEIRSSLAQILEQHPPEDFRDPYVRRAALFLATSSALMVTGIVMFFQELNAFTGIIDTGELMPYGVAIAAVLVGMLIIAALLLLRGSSRVHLVAIELLLVGFPGAVLAATSWLGMANAYMDEGEPLYHQMAVVDRDRTYNIRSLSTSYLLKVEDWTGRGRPWQLSVNHGVYNEYVPGETDWVVEVIEMPGAMGVRWVKSMRLMR